MFTILIFDLYFMFTCVRDVGCGGRLEASTGVIQSPAFPQWYPPHRDCFWTVVVPTGSNVEFTVGFLQMEQSVNCSKDYLEVNLIKLYILFNYSLLVVDGRRSSVNFYCPILCLSDS